MAQNPLSPVTSPVHSPNSASSFPIIAIGVIGICATAFLLVTYYIFVIKCCLNWHRIEILRRFSLSRRSQEPLVIHSPVETRGLDSSLIRSIPLIQYKTPTDDYGRSGNCECAVCLSEFQEEEQLRKIPNCSHLFHIDCIDIWLQNNSNCPLCRTNISTQSCLIPTHHHLVNPSAYPRDLHPSLYSGNLISTADEDFVVIELGNNREHPQEQLSSGELPASSICANSPRKFGRRVHIPKYGTKLEKITSMGDECIDMRKKDEQFSIQPIRRSFSMDSSSDRQLYLAIQETLQQNRQGNNAVSVSPASEGCSSSSRVRRSFFSFGHGRASRNAVSPMYLEP